MQPARIEFLTALLRGWHGKCPRCGAGSLFGSFLKMRSLCPACDLALEPYRADDAPAYFTILLVGHIVVPLVLVLERYGDQPPLWFHAAVVAAAVGSACPLPSASHKRHCHRAPVGAPNACSQAFDRELRLFSLKRGRRPAACAIVVVCWVWKCR